MSAPDRILHYVRHHNVPAWEAAGWRDLRSLEGTHHGEYSTLMEWVGQGEPVFPPDEFAGETTQ